MITWLVVGAHLAAVGIQSPPCSDPRTLASRDVVQGEEVAARFTIRGGGYDSTVTYTQEANLIFCRATSETMVWIRLAASKSNEGESGPHVDIDLCNVSGDATFSPMNARGRPCPGGQTWALWWHDGPDVVFATSNESAPCELQLVVSDGMLEGRFECHGLKASSGETTLDIVDGWFRCEWTGGSFARSAASSSI